MIEFLLGMVVILLIMLWVHLGKLAQSRPSQSGIAEFERKLNVLADYEYEFHDPKDLEPKELFPEAWAELEQLKATAPRLIQDIAEHDVFIGRLRVALSVLEDFKRDQYERHHREDMEFARDAIKRLQNAPGKGEL